MINEYSFLVYARVTVEIDDNNENAQAIREAAERGEEIYPENPIYNLLYELGRENISIDDLDWSEMISIEAV